MRKKEMPHPSELPNFRQVINAKRKEWEFLSQESAVQGSTGSSVVSEDPHIAAGSACEGSAVL